MGVYARHVQAKTTPQSEPIPGREAEMIPNAAGGFVFAVDDWTRLNRFLILGAEGGTYYASEKGLSRENAACVSRCLAADAERTIRTIVEVSESGRAPKQGPALFALALAAAEGHAKAVAEVITRVCRIGTDVLAFASDLKTLKDLNGPRGAAVRAWYAQDASTLAFQVAKYAQRNGWSHRDLLRLVRPSPSTPVFQWIVAGMEGMGPRTVTRKGVTREYPGFGPETLPAILQAHEACKKATTKQEVVQLIREQHIPREFLEGPQSKYLNDPEVWEALLEGMPAGAMVRNLGKMTAVGLLKPMSAAAKLVADRLGDPEVIRKSRLHPLNVLTALKTYASGHGVKGSLTWAPVSQVNDALDGAFYTAFGNVVPAGKRTLIGLDVSGSMSWSVCGGVLSCAEGAAALAMVVARTEPSYQLMAFANTFRPIDISSCSRLADVLAKTRGMNFGATDCALPMTHALAEKWDVDTFVVLTDNETWAGSIQPCQALVEYRRRRGIPARSAIWAMTATECSIADPTDAGQMDFCGFDSAAPGLIADFSAGRV